MGTAKADSALKRVMVVEDDPAIGVLMASILSDAGYVPFVVQDGLQALRAVHDLHPDAITLDLELPGVDGHTVLRRLEDDASDRPLPVVIVSSSTSKLSREELRLVAETLTKPFDLFDLVRAVDNVVERR
jgi:DNA-binding response OmpR family regulator